MDLGTLVVSVVAFADHWFQQVAPRLRQRGPQPNSADSEVLTIRVAGAFLGLGTDKETFLYFRRHWAHLFPKLTEVHRTNYARLRPICGGSKHWSGKRC